MPNPPSELREQIFSLMQTPCFVNIKWDVLPLIGMSISGTHLLYTDELPVYACGKAAVFPQIRAEKARIISCVLIVH